MRTSRAGRFISALGLCLWTVTLRACAQQGAPQGGPPDTTPPSVEMTFPGSGDVLVARDRGLSLQFTEPIEKPTLENGLTLSPARAGKPEFKWSNGSRRVDIFWPDSLRDSTTYRVTVTNRVADRRGNKIVDPNTFAFSTGQHVDRGEIRGTVRFTTGRPEAFDVFAYRLDAMPDTFWLMPPDYATQSGADGKFELPFLRAGAYRLLLLTDANRNQKLNHGEQFALATRDIMVGDEIPPDSFDVFPILYDTLPLDLKSCVSSGPDLISVNFSHPLDTNSMAGWRIHAQDSSAGALVGTLLIGPTPRRTSSVLLDGAWVAGEVYTVVVTGIRDQRGRKIESDSCNCTSIAVNDSSAPRIEWVRLPSITEALAPNDPIIWVFSEPMDTARLSGAITVADTGGSAISGSAWWRDVQTLTFTPEATWPDTVEVVAKLDSTRISDRQGNPALAGPFKWQFRPLGSGFLGAIEGRTESKLSGVPDYWIEAQEVGKSRATRVRLSGPGQFTLNLPAGRWQLGGFVDTDSDGRWAPGSLRPFSAPESRATPSDTLDVRARFTLEDIILRF